MPIQRIIETRWAALDFSIALLLAYAVLPFTIYFFFIDEPYFLELARLTLLAVGMISIGYFLPVFDSRFTSSAKRLRVDAFNFHILIWFFFLIFVIVTVATAESVPLISALRGVPAEILSQQRGEFLKARIGPGAALAYLSTLFVSALLPYSMVNLFIDRQRFRYFLLFIFLFYSAIFLQKALFINVLVPLVYLVAVRGQRSTAKMLFMGIAGAVLLYVLTKLAFVNYSGASAVTAPGDFWKASYMPSNPIDHLFWRIIAVPIFTAADALRVFAEEFGGKWLWGATSSFLAVLSSLEHIPFEKMVYEYQWGWNDTANANATYITEAYVNFGWVGVILFSLFVGQTLRWFRRSQDYAFKSLWPIYCFAIFTSGLIGTMFSNGYTLIFLLSLFARLSRQTYRKCLPSINPK